MVQSVCVWTSFVGLFRAIIKTNQSFDMCGACLTAVSLLTMCSLRHKRWTRHPSAGSGHDVTGVLPNLTKWK
ncbi:hypothetical protein RRG08_031810 [Elysia crispata]|uniref:Uncharacterized protein n=1 Tax=Elysia crispata TaxID=231223 RepID=A0AAE1CT59_9GAST|nr:hypothetical protein RRG08_031810 [Elysia crispata]